MGGLQNRFPEDVRFCWMFWYSCMVCNQNRIDILHHIISPTVRFYKTGDHNKSVFNSCPLHNDKCHIGNEAYLHKDENIKSLLHEVLHALKELGYQPNGRDYEFLKAYKHLYSKSDLEMVKCM